jgi:hypothetical protein
MSMFKWLSAARRVQMRIMVSWVDCEWWWGAEMSTARGWWRYFDAKSG